MYPITFVKIIFIQKRVSHLALVDCFTMRAYYNYEKKVAGHETVPDERSIVKPHSSIEMFPVAPHSSIEKPSVETASRASGFDALVNRVERLEGKLTGVDGRLAGMEKGIAEILCLLGSDQKLARKLERNSSL